jgi:hypothetical protein
LLFLDDIYYWCSKFYFFDKNIIENNTLVCEKHQNIVPRT